ncbi:MAG: hypothetical protein ACI9VM_000563 [Candidatus Azotimanducaceae bacterium]|jgi:hypothetical protein
MGLESAHNLIPKSAPRMPTELRGRELSYKELQMEPTQIEIGIKRLKAEAADFDRQSNTEEARDRSDEAKRLQWILDNHPERKH